MSTLKDLLAQREAIEIQIGEMRERERSAAIVKAQALIYEYELTSQELFRSGPKALKGKVANKVAAKYRDPETGATWTGRGKAPLWIADRDRVLFAI